MQRTRYASEFRDEAVKQVIDKGHSLADMAILAILLSLNCCTLSYALSEPRGKATSGTIWCRGCCSRVSEGVTSTRVTYSSNRVVARLLTDGNCG